MDEIAKYNQSRWKALTEADALFTRPRLNLSVAAARRIIDSDGRLGSLGAKTVLCLASGGGQQSAAFARLGAKVTVFDISAEQLERDRIAAAHYRAEIETLQGDMRDLSAFADSSFDVVYQAYSLNFVPVAAQVFRQVAKVLRKDGFYWFSCANPFLMGVQQKDWDGCGYVLKMPYADGAEVTSEDPNWVYDKADREPIPNPVEYRHTLSNLINGLIGTGFSILHVSDNQDMYPDPNAKPQSWEHFTAFVPPWISFLTKKT